MSDNWEIVESIDPAEAEALVKSSATSESLAEISRSPLSVAKVVRKSSRAGLVLCNGVPCAIIGVRGSITPEAWLIALKGLRGRVKQFVRFIKTVDYDGPVWARAADRNAKLIRLVGGQKYGSLWRLR